MIKQVFLNNFPSQIFIFYIMVNSVSNIKNFVKKFLNMSIMAANLSIIRTLFSNIHNIIDGIIHVKSLRY